MSRYRGSRYRGYHHDTGIAWTAALAVLLASILLVHWLVQVSVLEFAGLGAGLLVALLASWVLFPPGSCHGTG